MRDFEIPSAIADAIERFANKLADELEQQSKQAIALESEAALRRAAHAAREAGKSNRTRRNEAREIAKASKEGE